MSKQTRNKEIRRERWENIVDILLFIPELILWPFKLIYRGIVSLIRFWWY